MKQKKTTKSGTLGYIVINKETGEYSHSTSARKAEGIHKELTAAKIRMHITNNRKNYLKGQFIILDLRDGSDEIHIEKSLINLFK